MPLPGLGFFPIPQPHALMQDVDPQPAFRAVAQGDGLPSGRELLPNPAVDPQGWGLRLKRGRGTTAGRLGRWDDRLRILQVKPLVLVNIPKISP